MSSFEQSSTSAERPTAESHTALVTLARRALESQSISTIWQLSDDATPKQALARGVAIGVLGLAACFCLAAICMAIFQRREGDDKGADILQGQPAYEKLEEGTFSLSGAVTLVGSTDPSLEKVGNAKPKEPSLAPADHPVLLNTKPKSPSPNKPAKTSASPTPSFTTFDTRNSPLQKGETPGPGTYDIDKVALAVLCRATSNKPIAEGKGTFMRTDNRDPPASMTEQHVDPGHYNDYYLENTMTGKILQSPNKLVQSGKLPFGSNESRDAKEIETTPCKAGPGDYEFYHLYGVSGRMNGVPNSTNALVSLRSKAPRLGPLSSAGQDTPGAGHYEPELQEKRGFSYSKKGQSAFASNTPLLEKRALEGSATGEVIGPGSYEARPAIGAVTKNPKAPPFGSNVKRFDPAGF